MRTTRRRPTLAQIARETGFSASTVSRALRDDPRVAPETIERIKKVSARVGFTGNALASSLRTGSRSALIGVVVPSVADPFFAELAAGVQTAAGLRGRQVLLGCHNDDADEQKRLLSEIIRHRIEALLIVPAPGASVRLLAKELEFGTTVVALDRPLPGLACDTIVTNNAAGAAALAHTLVEQGHREFLVATLDLGIWTQRERLDAVRAALAGHGIEVTDDAIMQADLNGQIDSEIAQTAFRTHPDATALLALSVPPVLSLMSNPDVSTADLVIGAFDRHPYFNLLDARILSVAQNPTEIGRIAVARVIQRAEGSLGAPEVIELSVSDPVWEGRSHA